MLYIYIRGALVEIGNGVIYLSICVWLLGIERLEGFLSVRGIVRDARRRRSCGFLLSSTTCKACFYQHDALEFMQSCSLSSYVYVELLVIVDGWQRRRGFVQDDPLMKKSVASPAEPTHRRRGVHY